MRNFASVAVALLMLAVAVPLASGAGAPTYRVVFSGNATEHHVDVQRYVQDTGACNARESIDETAQLGWSATFSGLTANRGGRPVVAPRPIASMVGGRHVKDACGLALDAAPADWLGESTCDDPLQAIAAPTVAIDRKTKTALVLVVTAPTYAVPVTSKCSLNVRGDELVAHVTLPLAALTKLAHGKSVARTIGTTRPGAGDVYAPKLACSQPTKLYEGYRVDDECLDELTWSGTVIVTRV